MNKGIEALIRDSSTYNNFELIFADFARLMQYRLYSVAFHSITVNLEKIRMQAFGDFYSNLPSKSCIGIVQLNQQHQGIIALDSLATYSLLELALGCLSSPGQHPRQPMTYTQITRKILECELRSILIDFKESFSKSGLFQEAEYSKIGYLSTVANIFQRSDLIFRCSFSIKLDSEHLGDMYFVTTKNTFVGQEFNLQYSKDTLWSQHVFNALGNSICRMPIVASEFNISLNTLKTWKINSLIPVLNLDKGTLYCLGNRICKGDIQQQDNKLFLKINEVLNTK